MFWNPASCILEMGTAWDGSWRRMGIFTFVHFIMSCKVPFPLSFLGKVFEKLRPLSEFLFLFGLQLGKRFSWLIIWNKGFAFVDWCVMCRCCRETVDRLMLHCEKAYWLWNFVFRSFGISWVLPSPMNGTRFSLQMVELVGEALVKHLEFGSIVLNVVYMEGL